MRKISLFVLFALFIVAALTGCGGKSNSPTAPPVITITSTASAKFCHETNVKCENGTTVNLEICSELKVVTITNLTHPNNCGTQQGCDAEAKRLADISARADWETRSKLTVNCGPTQTTCTYVADQQLYNVASGEQDVIVKISLTPQSSATCSPCTTVPNPLPAGVISITSLGGGSFRVRLSNNTAYETINLNFCGGGVTIIHNPPASCNYVVSPTRITFPWEGGQQTVVITSPNECTCTNISAPGLTWQLNGNQLVLTAGVNGYSARSGIVVFCNAVIDWSQNPRPENPPQQTCQDHDATNYGQPGDCSYAAPTVTLTANPTTVVQNGFSSLIYSYSNAEYGCTMSGDWSGTKSASHNTISGSQSTGSLTSVRTYNYGLTCKGKGGERTASATITVTAAQTCTYSFPTSYSIKAGGGSGTIIVNTTPDSMSCQWSHTSPEFWFRFTNGPNHIGDGEARYDYDPNTTGATRNITLRVAGQNVQITQPSQ